MAAGAERLQLERASSFQGLCLVIGGGLQLGFV